MYENFLNNPFIHARNPTIFSLVITVACLNARILGLRGLPGFPSSPTDIPM